MPDDQPPADFDHILRQLQEAGRNIKFGAGVVGKTSRAMLAILGVWAIVVTRLSGNLVKDAVLVGAAILATIFAMWWVKSTQNFAERNPGQALLEGAQLIEYKRFEAQSKGIPSMGHSPLIEDPNIPKAVAVPDSELPDA